MRLLLLISAVTSLLVAGCTPIFSDADCSDRLVRAEKSGDGRVVASLVRRNCGATTAYSNSVYLKKSDDAIGKDGLWGEKVFVMQGDVDITMRWNARQLRLAAPRSGRDVFLSRRNWENIEIVYE